MALPGTAETGAAEEGFRINSTALPAEQAGISRLAPQPLDAEETFALLFRFRLLAETHQRAERAGFSVIVLTRDRRGIELGFQAQSVFAQADEPLFTRGEEAQLDLLDRSVAACLAIAPTGYRLFLDGELALEGPLRDYTAFQGLIDPYETPNFIFFGDDTRSAAADVVLGRIAIARPPKLRLEPDGALAWSGLPETPYRVEASEDLKSWRLEAAVSSPDGNCRFLPAPEGSRRFYRVAVR